MSAAEGKPAVDAILQKVLETQEFALLGDDDVETARQRLHDLHTLMPAERLPDLRIENRHLNIASPDGVGVRIYWPPEDPERSGPPPVLMFFHGGRFVVGDLDTHDAAARRHAVGAGAVVVSVDYRLAPEHPYPAAIDDAWAATCWTVDNAWGLGADPARLAVAGDSAGGTIAAVVTQLARDADGPPMMFQLLWYPAPMRDHSLPSYTENADAPVLDRATLELFGLWYAGDIDPDHQPPKLAPGRNPNLAGLPPAYIAVAGHDPVRDEGVQYAELLAAAGVPVEFDRAVTLVHGFVSFASIVPAASEAVDRGLSAVRNALHPA
ncbi:MAG: alpha/beta hydrolase [Mycobacterium sp.]